MSGIVAQDWIWSVPAAPTTRKSRRDIGPQTSRAVDGVYLSSWKSTTTVRPQTLWAGSFQYVATPSLNDGGSGAPVPVCGAWMPMLMVLLVMPVESPPAVEHLPPAGAGTAPVLDREVAPPVAPPVVAVPPVAPPVVLENVPPVLPVVPVVPPVVPSAVPVVPPPVVP